MSKASARDLVYHAIPASNALVEVGSWSNEQVAAIVRCAERNHRLFDVVESDVIVGYRALGEIPIYESQCLVFRKCPKCKTMNRRHVTGRPGYPVGDDGPWTCNHCDAHLSLIDAPRGRLVLTCPKCRRNRSGRKPLIRVTASDAVGIAKSADAANRRQNDLRQSLEFDPDIDDVPF